MSGAFMVATMHVAGAMINGVQRCTRCGAVLEDITCAAWPEGEPAPQGWRPNAIIGRIRGNPTFTYEKSDEFPVEVQEIDCGS